LRFLVPGYTKIKIKQKFGSAKLNKDFECKAGMKVNENKNLRRVDFSQGKT